MTLLANILSSMLLFAVPLLLVALGGMFSERSGVINIALEGIMVIGALFSSMLLSVFAGNGFFSSHPILSMLLAILAAAASGVIFSMALAFASIKLKADQTIGGTALNQFAPAFAIMLTWAVQGLGQTTINIPTWTRMAQVFGVRSDESVGYALIWKNFYLTTPVALIVLCAAWVLLYKTRFGMRLMACGEHPQAAGSVGINVYKMRYIGVGISGALGGIGGLAYTLAAGSTFQSTVMGYGFLALAVMIFGNWKPLSIFASSLFFAFFKVLPGYVDSIGFMPKFEGVKQSGYIYLMLPYIVTMIVLILTSKRSRAPKAEGIPYDKGAR